MTLSRIAKVEVLRAAMHGYSAQIEELLRKRREAEEMLAELEHESPTAAKPMETAREANPTPRPTHRKRRISAEGRKAIIAAARKRWAKYRAEKRAAAR